MPTKTRFDRVSSTNCPALGRIRQAIGGWTKAGCPRNQDGTFKLAAVVRWRVSRMAQAQSDRVSPALEEWRQAKAAREKLALARDRGQFVSIDDAASFWTDRIMAARTALQSVGMALGMLLEGKSAAEIQVHRQKELRRWSFAAHRRIESGSPGLA